MGNTVLTPTAVTRKALAILHQKLNFVGNVNRTYDASFAKTGAKIGDSLKIRLPNEFTIRSGASLSTQDVTETSTTLQVATQKGVDTTFSSSELSLSLDDFASRILQHGHCGFGGQCWDLRICRSSRRQRLSRVL